MVPENEEPNPFETPQAKVSDPVSRSSWVVLWAAIAVFFLLVALCAVFEITRLLATLIVVIGIPALIRTASDLNRKAAAGQIVDYGVQLKSLGVSFGLTAISLLAAGIAGGTVCFAGILAGEGPHDGIAFTPILIMMLGIPVGLVVFGFMAYYLGPPKLETLQEEALDHDAPSEHDQESSEGASP
ncbi:hypothetical protein [Blastopirellula marina]|uniref:Uncharacterized protein n=1 Tax=Blastopirellula marina TaxID=124 RepID=A0A2S8GJL5_9BACT|nr:hypothetical protein [Blastopirellula marina]PQO44647.1 hypothetical protein C5Y93_17915 [Blastopirellula marina]